MGEHANAAGSPETDGLYRAATKSGTQDSGVGLESFFTELLHAGTPSPLLPPIPKPVERVWSPAADLMSPLGTFIKVRPELQDIFPGLPIKSFKKRRLGGRGIKTKRVSRVNGRTMQTDSLLEADAIQVLELDPRITRFIEQPVDFRYPLNGVAARCIPDLYVDFGNWAEFWEIKFEDEASEQENESRWMAIGEALSSRGYGYRVMTERHLRGEPRRSNVKTIFNARHERPSPSLVDALRVFLERQGSAAIGDCCAAGGLSEQNVHHLVRIGLLAADIEFAPIKLDTVVWLRAARRGW